MGVLCSALLASGKLQLFTSRSNHTETMKIPWISDIYVKTCWSPCFWHPTVRSGSYAVAGYTLGMALCLLTYTAYIMQGGDSSQFYLPLFETDLNGEMQPAGQFVILYMLAMIVVSLLLMWGIRRDIR